MAITNNGIKNSLPASQLPDTYTRPTVTTFDDAEYKGVLNLTIVKATVENADPATTMANIIDNATVGIKKQIDDILTADYASTATGNAYADLVSLRNNMQSMAKGADAYTTATLKYQARVLLFVKTN